MPDYGDDIRVYVPGPLQPHLQGWLSSRGLYLFPITNPPLVDKLPTYGIGKTSEAATIKKEPT